MDKIRVYIDAGPLLEERMSGIGNVTLNIVRQLSQNEQFLQQYQLFILVPSNKTHLIDRFQFNKNVYIKKIWLKARIINGLIKYNLLPPMDLIIGKGIYIFPNFKNWPLLFSKSLTYIHDVSFKVFPEFIEEKNLQMLNNSIDRFLRRADKVVTVSKSSRQEILKYFDYLPDNKVVVVPNGIDQDLFKRASNETIDALKKKYNLPQKYFIYLSNLEPRKNLRVLLDAFEKLPLPEQKVAGLLIIGGMGWRNEEIIRKIDKLQEKGLKVIKPSHYVPDDDLPGLISGAICLVHPAHHEGFGLSPLQALACETPVIVSRIDAIEEVVGDSGTYINDRESSSELTRQLQIAYSSSLHTQTQERSLRQRALDYTWRQSGQQLVKVIEEVAL